MTSGWLRIWTRWQIYWHVRSSNHQSNYLTVQGGEPMGRECIATTGVPLLSYPLICPAYFMEEEDES